MVIIAVDESGDFATGSTDRHFHVAVALRERQEGGMSARLEKRFRERERSTPGTARVGSHTFLASRLALCGVSIRPPHIRT